MALAVMALAVSVLLALMLGSTNLPADAAVSKAELPDELQAAEQVYRQEGPEAAQAEFRRLSEVYQKSGDVRAHATAVRFVGEIHWRMGEYEAGEQVLTQALELSVVAGDPELEAKVLNVLGLLHWDLGEYDAALASFDRAGKIADELGDRRMQGAILNNAALVRDEQGEYRTSLGQYRQVLALYAGQDFARGEGDTLGNIGGVHLLLGHYREALEQYQQALAISESLESTTSLSQDHGNIALSQLGLGDTSGALQHFDRAIELADEAGMRQDVAFWMRGKANALIRQGKYEQGLALHRKAVELYEEIGTPTEAVEALHDLGLLYLALGDPASAEASFQSSMARSREIGLARAITINLLALGDLQVRRQGREEADALYRQAWQRAQEAGEMNLVAESLLRLSGLHLEQGRYEDAQREAQEALDIATGLGALYAVAEAGYVLGEISRLQGAADAAIAHYTTALKTLPEIIDPELAWRMHYGTGLALADQDKVPAAIAELQLAVELIEGVRDRLEEQRFRTGYLQDKFQVYADLVRLQMSAGQAENAFSTAERLRARSYRDLVERDTLEAGAAGSGEADEIELRERIRQLRKVISEENAMPASERRQPALSVYSEELLAAERAYEVLLDDRHRMQPAGRSTRAPANEEVRQQLQAGEGLLEYVVGEGEVMIFVLTREAIVALTGNMGRERLHSRVELLRDLIRHPEGDGWRRPAASLAEVLIGPLNKAGALENLQHLYVVPHGILNYLPFALLPTGENGGRLMLEDFTLAYLPTAAALLENRQPRHDRQTLLAMAPARSRLQHATTEANAVFGLFDPDSRLLVGELATETLFKEVAGDYDVLHLATHGYFNKLNPLLSGLELEADASNDGLLELHEILGMQLDAELVTLSACQTGLGSGYFAEIPAGDDFVGLTRAFLYSGSESVLATLWEVDDASTSELMQQFYQRLRVPAGTSDKAGALAAVQRAMSSSKDYHHPYYWAPFVLMGTSHPPLGKALGV